MQDEHVMKGKSTEVFVPAQITHVEEVERGEIRRVQLTLPVEFEYAGTIYPIRDVMRPGTAFLARPWGARTRKIRRRMYTRSNCALTQPQVLETFINDTHREKADTSPWWQSKDVLKLMESGGGVDVRVDLHSAEAEFVIFENTLDIQPSTLRLEPDDEWGWWKMLALGLSTGVTPFLAYVRYMQAKDFGRTLSHPGVDFVLIVSVRHAGQLMAHQELLRIAEAYPENFRYYPVLTRQWADDWPFGKGRILRGIDGDGQKRVDLSPLLGVVPDLPERHVRFCGNLWARDELKMAFEQENLAPRSFRAEVW